MKVWEKLLHRIIQVESAVAGIISRLNKIEADLEYVSMMTDVDIETEEGGIDAE